MTKDSSLSETWEQVEEVVNNLRFIWRDDADDIVRVVNAMSQRWHKLANCTAKHNQATLVKF